MPPFLPKSNLCVADVPAAVPDDASDRLELSRLRFIPFRRSDLLSMLRSAMEPLGDADLARDFEAGVELIRRAFADEFHTLRQELRTAMHPWIRMRTRETSTCCRGRTAAIR